MWKEYFCHAQVWGIDIDPNAAKEYGEGIHVVTGSQADVSTEKKTAPDCVFDIVIDDASHLVQHQIQSFNLFWSRVKSGGFYVIEDLGCSYLEDACSYREIWPGQRFNPLETTDWQNKRGNLNGFFLQHLQTMDGLHGDIRFIHFWPMQCIIGKAWH
jgi:hypothetical protein